MFNQYALLQGLEVEVENLVFKPELEASPDFPDPVVYFIKITNRSKLEVTLFGRKWILRDPDGSLRVIEGVGLVGSRPTLQPGQSFKYQSYHLCKGRAEVDGAFFGETDDGFLVYTIIPAFEIRCGE